MSKSNRGKALQITGVVLVLFFMGSKAFGQISVRELKGGDENTINTAVPFITIAPDSRAGALGDAGVATQPDINSQHWNVAKYAFMEETGGLSISYTPWLRKIIPDINLAYLSTYWKPTDDQVISGSLRYFSLGQITFTDIEGGIIGQYNPYEMAMDAGYSRLFSDNFSGGIAFRFIYSNLTSGQDVGGEASQPGIAVASDLGFYYQDDLRLVGGNDAGYAWGVTLSNLGTPISYTADADKIPIPSNLRLGGRFDYGLDDYNEMSFSLEFNKLLVPTRPIKDNDGEVVRGYEDPESIVLGMIQSFYDAPGISYDDGSYSTGFREEMAEVMVSAGVEYWYREQFAIRAGYFHEAAVKGNRKYVTLGVGLKLNVFSLDFAYLVPTNGQESPLANTLRFTLGFDFESLKL
ncbi:MAG: type IX secretion system outer membrane channel protein PorV [Bacteroidales bacterium]|nr:type IX secretion system outer membrane channel protein PorV [Bacteroidales bacterium]